MGGGVQLNNLTGNKILTTDSDKNIIASTIESTVLNYLDGLKTNIQSYMNTHWIESMSRIDYGIVETDTFENIKDKLMQYDSIFTYAWISSNTTYGQELSSDIGLGQLYGHMFIFKTRDNQTLYFVLVSYTASYIFFRTYSITNSFGWSNWKRIQTNDTLS